MKIHYYHFTGAWCSFTISEIKEEDSYKHNKKFESFLKSNKKDEELCGHCVRAFKKYRLKFTGREAYMLERAISDWKQRNWQSNSKQYNRELKEMDELKNKIDRMTIKY